MVVLLDLVHIVVAYVPAGLIKIGLGNMLVYHARFKTDMNRNGKSTVIICIVGGSHWFHLGLLLLDL